MLAGLTLAWSLTNAATSASRLPHIGVLFSGNAGSAESVSSAFRDGLVALGWIEGRTVSIEWRSAGDSVERLVQLAELLVRGPVDVLLAGGPAPLAVLRRLTTTIPIVAIAGGDPMREGWAHSLAHPGGNVTGLTVTFPEMSGKRLALLKEALQAVRQVGVLLAPAEADRDAMLEDLAEPARRLEIRLVTVEVRAAQDLERAFVGLRANAILTMDTNLLAANRRLIGKLAMQSRMPLMAEFADFGTDGLLLAYGASVNDLLRRAAAHVDRILRGTAPGDLPIERPDQFELTVNLRTARDLGIVVPRTVLLRADRVIQ